MRILAHRGHWLTPSEKNSPAAFERAWANGHGIETDLRDRDGEIVVSHDPASASAAPFQSLLEAHAAQAPDTMLALNIKADGLQGAVSRLLAQYRVRNYFVFDMSVPDTLHYLAAGMRVFLRLSEYESETTLFDRASGVWLDGFAGEWWTLDLIRSLCARGKSVAIVSSELHGRDHQMPWRQLKTLEDEVRAKIMLCTDFPDAAEQFFAD
jgi:glycerophosphoryl diester phosphodiesterase